MKQNVVKLVLNGVDHKELVNVIAQYLDESAATALVEHFSGDTPLMFEVPEYDEEKLNAYLREHNSGCREAVKFTVDSVEINVFTQKIRVKFTYYLKKFFETQEKAEQGTSWDNKEKLEGKYQYEGLYKSWDDVNIPCEEFKKL